MDTVFYYYFYPRNAPIWVLRTTERMEKKKTEEEKPYPIQHPWFDGRPVSHPPWPANAPT